MLSDVVLLTAFGLQAIDAQSLKSEQATSQIKADVARLGLGEKARVEVKMRDNTRLKGYVSTVGEDSFTVIDSKTGASKTLAYADVARVKKPGGGLSTRTWIIIGGAATAAIIVGVTVIKPVLCDGC
jgi:hypothetical protein